MGFEAAMAAAKQYLTFNEQFIDPSEPQGLWFCANVAEASDIQVNAVCLGMSCGWDDLVKCRPFFALFPYLVIVTPNALAREELVKELRPRLPAICIYVVQDAGFRNCKTIRAFIEAYGMRELSVWTGRRGVGKSTLLSQLLLEAVDQGHCVCAYSGELPKEQFREWAYLQAAGPEHVIYRQDGATGKKLAVSDPMADKLISQWLDERFWLFDLERNTRHDPQTILSQFEYARMRYNCDVFLVDNIMSVDMDGFSDREFNRAQSKFTQMLSTFSKRRGVHTHLVVHPRKSTSGSNEQITSDDVSGSGDITNRADNVFFLTTHNAGGESKPLLQVLKNRDFGSHRHQWLDFDTKSRRFFQDQTGNPKRPYGWDLNARQLALEEVAAGPEIDAVFPEEGK